MFANLKKLVIWVLLRGFSKRILRFGKLELNHPQKYVCKYKRNNQKEYNKHDCTIYFIHFKMCFTHRDKTRLQMAAKKFPHLKVLCWLFMGPTFSFDTKQRNSFLIKSGLFTMKTIFWQYYSYLNMRKSHFNEEFLVLLGPIMSRFFVCSNEEKGCML